MGDRWAAKKRRTTPFEIYGNLAFVASPAKSQSKINIYQPPKFLTVILNNHFLKINMFLSVHQPKDYLIW